MKKYHTITKVMAAIILLLTLICIAVPYAVDADRRVHAQDWIYEKSTEDHGKYTAKMAVFKEETYLKLYETSTGELLAERLYYHGDIMRLLWSKDSLGYTTNEDTLLYDGSIKLPPGKFDKILTYLP